MAQSSINGDVSNALDQAKYYHSLCHGMLNLQAGLYLEEVTITDSISNIN